MSNGTSNRTELLYIAETTPGTTPNTPAFKSIRYTGESLLYDITTTQSNEIRPDRNVSDTVQTKAGAAGDINFELSMNSFDDFLAAALCNTWAADVLKNGVVNQTFSIQKKFNDTTAITYQTFRRMKVGTLALEFASGAILTGKFSFMGSDAIISTTQITGATYVAAGDDTPMNGVNNVQDITENGSASVTKFKKISLNVDNSLRALDAIGSLGPIDIALGTCNVTGSFDVYFSDLVTYQRFLNNTSVAISFKAQDSSGSNYKFTLPKVKIEKADIVSGGKDQDLMVTCTYRAIYDPVTQCAIQIDRTII